MRAGEAGDSADLGLTSQFGRSQGSVRAIPLGPELLHDRWSGDHDRKARADAVKGEADQGQHLVRHRGDRGRRLDARGRARSEEHTSELQSLMRISFAVFCLKKNIITYK